MDSVETIRIGSSSRPFPFLKDIWSFFLEKGSKTVFFSIGTSDSPLAELEIAESLGCPIHIFDTTDDSANQWNSVKSILEDRKVTDTTGDFASVAAKKWVLSKHILYHSGFPYSFSGKLEDGTRLFSVEEILSKNEGVIRVDLLKIDKQGWEDKILSGIMAPGFRPSLLIVNWSESPNESYKTMVAAGNLTMMGYTLLGREENRCLYYFTGMTLYETVDWYMPKCKNPLVSTLLADYTILPKTNETVNEEKN
jgi:hypothetical protein